MKPLLVFTTDGLCSDDQAEIFSKYLTPIAEALGAELAILPGGTSLAVQHDMGPVFEALAAQTDALQKIARTLDDVTGGSVAMRVVSA